MHRGGLVVYRIWLKEADVPAGAALDFFEPVHDAAQVRDTPKDAAHLQNQACLAAAYKLL